MRARMFIVTFNRPQALRETLDCLAATDWDGETFLINNHSRRDPAGPGGFPSGIRIGHVFHNDLRPDRSVGNLAENYNQALLHGFVSLSRPDTDVVITLQDDALLAADWWTQARRLLERFAFVEGRYGDNIVCHRAESARRVGMWDENIFGIQYKEGDYWIRQLISNRDGAFIHDPMHNIHLNADGGAPVLDIRGHRNFAEREDGLKRLADDPGHAIIKQAAIRERDLALNYFLRKWSGTWREEPRKRTWVMDWPREFYDDPPKLPPALPQYVRYPWFEKDVYDLAGKGFIVP